MKKGHENDIWFKRNPLPLPDISKACDL